MHIEIRSPLLKAHQLAQRVDYIFSYMGIRKLRKFCQIYSTLIWENKNNITFFSHFIACAGCGDHLQSGQILLAMAV